MINKPVETPRCLIRRAATSDLPSLVAAFSQPEFPPQLPLAAMLRSGRLANWLETMCQSNPMRNAHLWSIDLQNGEKCIGQIGLLEHPVSEQWALSFWLAPPHWGQGLAAEAVSAALKVVRREHNPRPIWAAAAQWNQTSINLLLRLGFEETARQTCGYMVEGVPQATVEFSLNKMPNEIVRRSAKK